MQNKELLYKKLNALRLEVDRSIVDDIKSTVDALFQEQNLQQTDVSCSVGDLIQCRYMNRFVRGIVERVDDKYLVVKLETDYQGKNEEWCVGELKSLQFSLIKKLSLVANSR